MKKNAWLLAFLFAALLAFYRWPPPGHAFEALYDGNPAVAESLEAFRQEPLRRISVDDRDWDYYLAGEGPRTLLFLHGMGGAYDISWQQLVDLERDYRVLAVTYPPAPALDAMARALDRILTVEGIDRVTVIGSSLGGYLAQYLASYYPQRVEAAVFANTFPPNDILAERNRNLGRLLPWLPEWLVLRSFRGSVKDRVVPAAEDSPLVAAYLLEQGYGKMSKAQFYTRYRCVVEPFENRVPADLPILIIEADNDPLIDPELRQLLRRVYPKASVFTFRDKGHFPYLNEPERYAEVLRGWLGSNF